MYDRNPPGEEASATDGSADRPAGTGLGSTGPDAAKLPATELSEPAPRRVLVVDDQPAVRRLVAACLRDAGLDPAVAGDMQAALAHVEEAARTGRPFAVAVCDLTIPGGPGGHEIAASLRQIDPGLPIVAISGYTELAISSRAGSPFCAFLPKPFTPDQLDAVVSRCARPAAPAAPDASAAPDAPDG